MINYIEELNQLAAQNEGGDETPSSVGYKMVKRGNKYVALKGDRVIAESTDQATAQKMASQYMRNPPSPVVSDRVPSEFAPTATQQAEPYYPELQFPQNNYQLDQQLNPIQPRQPGQYDASVMEPRDVLSGLDPAKAVLQGTAAQGGAAGNMVTGNQGVVTSTTGAAPGQEEQAPRQRQRGGGTWSAPGLTEAFTQEDFYANTGPMVGQYSTGNEYVATPGRLPMGAISKAATILNNRQVELDQKRQAMMEELYKPIKTATPYQQNFNQIVNSEHDKFIKSVADAYTGGNIAKANRLIMSNPELRARWRQQNADLESLGARGEYVFNKAVNYLSDAATLKIASNPETRQLANDIIYGMGGYGTKDGKGGDFNTLISKINQFENLMGRDTYFKEKVVPSVKDFAAVNSLPYKVDRNGMFIFMTEAAERSFNTQKDALAREMTTTGFGSYAENYEFLDKMLPTSVETKTTVRDIPRATSGDGGGKQPMAPQVTASVKRSVTNPISPQYLQQSVVSFTPSEVTGDKLSPVSSYPLSSGVGSPKSTGFPALQWDEKAGEFNISALTLSTEVQDKIKQTMEDDSMSDDVKQREITRIMEGSPTNTYKLSQNRSFMADKYQTTDPYVVVSMSLAQSGISISPDELRMNWPRQDYRKQIMERLEGGSSAAPQPSELIYNPATGRLE
jgi:hypothetical protein